MFVPNKEGIYKCQECEFTTNNVFIMLNHCEMQFQWNVQMVGKHHVDIFQILETLDELIEEQAFDTVREYVQGIALCYVNSFDGDVNLTKMFEEILVRKNTGKIIEGMEKMLKDENS
jgi:hypothetical protein